MFKIKIKKNTKKKNRIGDSKNVDKQLKNNGVKKALNEKKTS